MTDQWSQSIEPPAHTSLSQRFGANVKRTSTAKATQLCCKRTGCNPTASGGFTGTNNLERRENTSGANWKCPLKGQSYLPPPHVHPPPRDDGSPPPRGEPLPSDAPPPPGGIDTIANEQITAPYYAEFMTDQLLAVRRPRL